MIGSHGYATVLPPHRDGSESGVVIRLLGGGEEASKVCNCCMGDSHEPWGIRIGESEGGESEGGESRTLGNPYWGIRGRIRGGRVTNPEESVLGGYSAWESHEPEESVLGDYTAWESHEPEKSEKGEIRGGEIRGGDGRDCQLLMY